MHAALGWVKGEGGRPCGVERSFGCVYWRRFRADIPSPSLTLTRTLAPPPALAPPFAPAPAPSFLSVAVPSQCPTLPPPRGNPNRVAPRRP